MGDLFCAATLLVARHGDADFEETWFSDEGGWLNDEGRAESRALGRGLTSRRVARVFSSDTSRAVQTAEIVAGELGLSGGSAVVTRKALREVFVGDLLGRPFDVDALHGVADRWLGGDLAVRFPGGESGADVVARFTGALQAIADEHRGETVLVVAHQIATAVAVRALTGHTAMLDNGEHLELLVDADGWRIVDRAEGRRLDA